jgi:hypothetical protein
MNKINPRCLYDKKAQNSHPFAQLLPAPESELRYVSGRKSCPRAPLRSFFKQTQYQSIEALSQMKHLYTPCCRHQTPNLLEHFVVHIVWRQLQGFPLLHQNIHRPNRETGQKCQQITLE